MSRIDKTNYEAWLLDYTEGNLSAEDIAELLLFLEQNPELKTDLDGLMDIQLVDDDLSPIDFKHTLIKDESNVKERFDALCLSFYDKTISASEKKELDYILQQKPHWEKEFKAFAFTYFIPAPEIEFPSKAVLKKQFLPEDGFENQAVKAIEGLMKPEERLVFERSLEGNAEKIYAWKAFQKSVLSKENIVFEEKSNLYKEKNSGRIVFLGARLIAIAASIALLIGLFSLFNSNKPHNGMASINSDTISAVRPVKQVVVPETNSFVNTVPKKLENKKSQKNNSQKPLRIEAPVDIQKESFADLKTLKAKSIEDFELPGEYLTINPYDNIQVNPQMPTAFVESEFLSPTQFLVSRAKGLLKKNKIDVEKPLREIKEDGLAETSYKSIERITRGNVNINREKTPTGSRVLGFSIGSLEFSRSSGR